jgi:hypothetical protein
LYGKLNKELAEKWALNQENQTRPEILLSGENVQFKNVCTVQKKSNILKIRRSNLI